MRPSLALPLAAALAGCPIPSLDLQGKACGPDHACPSGLVCNPFTLTCDPAVGCPYVNAGPSPCSSTDWYLGPTGSDQNAGTDPGAPRATLNQLDLYPGDVVHLLPGTYVGPIDTYAKTGFQTPMRSGTLQCPIQLVADLGGEAILQSTLFLSASHVTVHDLVLSAQHDHGVQSSGVDHDVLEGVTFRGVFGAPGEYLRDIWFTGSQGCDDCAIVNSDFFDSNGTVVAIANAAARLVLRGNRFHVDDGDEIALTGPAPVFAENDVTGTFSADLLKFDGTRKDGLVVRNVFHDLKPGGANVVVSAGQVLRNTFFRIPAGSTAADHGVFRDNLVAFMDNGLAQPMDPAGGYNLFDTVTTPYADSTAQRRVGATDKEGHALLNPVTFVPDAGSDAVDAADPALPVPPGGGDRADIGARERGAALLPDGTYCLPPDAGDF